MSASTSHELLTSAWTVMALLTFAGIVLWAWWPANRPRFDRNAQIPLDDER